MEEKWLNMQRIDAYRKKWLRNMRQSRSKKKEAQQLSTPSNGQNFVLESTRNERIDDTKTTLKPKAIHQQLQLKSDK